MLLGLILLFLSNEVTKVEVKANKGLVKTLKKRKGAKKTINPTELEMQTAVQEFLKFFLKFNISKVKKKDNKIAVMLAKNAEQNGAEKFKIVFEEPKIGKQPV